MPTVHGLELGYALYTLEAGRVPFRRERWELWHGRHLVASGWRFTRADACRALRARAVEFAHKLFGLPAPDARPIPSIRAELAPGAVERLTVGAITCLLVPRALERPQPVPIAA